MWLVSLEPVFVMFFVTRSDSCTHQDCSMQWTEMLQLMEWNFVSGVCMSLFVILLFGRVVFKLKGAVDWQLHILSCWKSAVTRMSGVLCSFLQRPHKAIVLWFNYNRCCLLIIAVGQHFTIHQHFVCGRRVLCWAEWCTTTLLQW